MGTLSMGAQGRWCVLASRGAESQTRDPEDLLLVDVEGQRGRPGTGWLPEEAQCRGGCREVAGLVQGRLGTAPSTWSGRPGAGRQGNREICAGRGMIGRLWVLRGSLPPARGRGRWLRNGGEQVEASPRSVDGPAMCLWELRTCWLLPPQPTRKPWSQS